ncbi:F-box only 5 [Pelobates cultripes]|uniref:F-box only 5 n=2 Tax=Pelobates cultripes TaxID=61616 RepID=A0AAD1RGE8_PELCU|nr:F-box only 5 [Pelobates cultripes]
MKCGFKSNQTPTKMSPNKINAANAKLEASPLKHEQDSCKKCEQSQGSQPDSPLKKVSPRRLDFATENKPLYNKENHLQRFKEVETQNLELSDLQDSGYSSILHDSPYQNDEDINFLIPPVCETPKLSSLHKTTVQATSASLFPVIHFEEVVCSTLKKSSKRSPKIDWNLIDEVVSRGNFGLENLIGKNMGLDQMDILGELFRRDFKHILAKILRHLGAIDLINVISVSTTWKKILHRDSMAYSTYKAAWKELCEKEAKFSVHTATRDSSLGRLPLASVQKIASASCCIKSTKKSSKKCKDAESSNRRHAEFSEIAKTLKNDQSLKVCRDCGSPAKYDSYLHRAICTRESCKSDFCTLCLCDYHFSKSCTSNKPQAHRYLSGPLPGSKKSKQNLRRL